MYGLYLIDQLVNYTKGASQLMQIGATNIIFYTVNFLMVYLTVG